MPPASHRVAIVGLGPKGLYCLERLVAAAAARPLRGHLHIDVFNRTPDFGSSPIYDAGQPDYLLVNIKVGEIDLWEPQEPPIVAQGGQHFVSWYRETFPTEQPLTGEEYLPRAVVGRYLVEGFRRVVGQLPPGVSVSRWVDEVIDLAPGPLGVTLTTRGAGPGPCVRADRVMLATGHARVIADDEAGQWGGFAEEHPAVAFVPAVYPTECLAGIPAGSAVAMLGLGLTFIDAALALTEGRGGRFWRDASGSLNYRPSGREPGVILPFSRTGLPMSPKSFDIDRHPRTPVFVTSEGLARRLETTSGHRLDLDRDLWPLIRAELQYQHIVAALGDRPERRLIDATAGDPDRFFAAQAQLMVDQPGLQPLDVARLLDPAGCAGVTAGPTFHRFIGGYLQSEISQANLGQGGSAVKAAVDCWYPMRQALGEALRRCWADPRSHQRLAEEVFPAFKRVAFGPPIINIEKLAALHRGGVLDFSMARRPQVVTDAGGPCFRLVGEAGTWSARAQALVDARYPPVDLARDASPLFANLRRRGLVRAFANASPGAGPSYVTGALDLADPGQCLVDAQGSVQPDVSVIGIPTEGWLTGNFSLTRDPFAGRWADDVIRQFAEEEVGTRRPVAPAQVVGGP